MNLVRCKNGHFYDSDKNGDICPYCTKLEQNTQVTDKIEEEIPTKPVEPPKMPVKEEIKPAVKNDKENTAEENDDFTVEYYSKAIGAEPVVGWLVCIEGEYKGESFPLKSGRNFIGRAANMDIVLSADYSVARLRHASVIYEPRSRKFIVAAGESRELCYLNNEVVLSNMKMEAYDVLNLGGTSLMLIPCCGERFSWEDGLSK